MTVLAYLSSKHILAEIILKRAITVCWSLLERNCQTDLSSSRRAKMQDDQAQGKKHHQHLLIQESSHFPVLGHHNASLAALGPCLRKT